MKKIVDSGIVKTCDELDLGALELLAVTGVFDLGPNGFESLGTHCFISHKEPVKNTPHFTIKKAFYASN